MDLHRSQSGKSIETEMGTLIRTREGLQLLHPEKHVAVPVEVKRFEGEIRIDFHHQSIQLTLPALSPEQYGAHAVFYLDADRIAWPIVFRSWQQGDRMTPYGMRGQKKLSDIFIDEKYSLPEKESAIVIADQEKILGLSGFRIADSVRVLPETQNLLRIEFLQDA